MEKGRQEDSRTSRIWSLSVVHHFIIAGIIVFALVGSVFLAVASAISATFASFSARILRRWAKRMMNKTSILRKVSECEGLNACMENAPFLGHHEKALHYDTLGDLGSNALEQG